MQMPWFTVRELALIALHDQSNSHKSITSDQINPDAQLPIVDHTNMIEILQPYMMKNTPCIVQNINACNFSPFTQGNANASTSSNYPPHEHKIDCQDDIDHTTTALNPWPTHWGKDLRDENNPQQQYPNFFSTNNHPSFPTSSFMKASSLANNDGDMSHQIGFSNCESRDNHSLFTQLLERTYGDELQQHLNTTRVNLDHFKKYYSSCEVTISNCAIQDANSQRSHGDVLGSYIHQWEQHQSRSLKRTGEIQVEFAPVSEVDKPFDHSSSNIALKDDIFRTEKESDNFVMYCRDWHLSLHHHELYQDQLLISKSPQSLPPQFYLPPLCTTDDILNQYWDYLTIANNILTLRDTTTSGLLSLSPSMEILSLSDDHHDQPSIYTTEPLNPTRNAVRSPQSCMRSNPPFGQSSCPTSTSSPSLVPPKQTNPLKVDDYRFVYFGPHSSFTPLHRDVYSSYSWSGNVVGVKLWIFLPPSYVFLTQTDPISPTVDLSNLFDEDLVRECSEKNHELFCSPDSRPSVQSSYTNPTPKETLYQSLTEWISSLRFRINTEINSRYDNRQYNGVTNHNDHNNDNNLDDNNYANYNNYHHDDNSKNTSSNNSTDPNNSPIIFLQFPGDLVFVPSFWAHQVINLTDCISINHNWGNSFNYSLMTSQLLFDNIAIQAGLDEYNDESDLHSPFYKWWEFKKLVPPPSKVLIDKLHGSLDSTVLSDDSSNTSDSFKLPSFQFQLQSSNETTDTPELFELSDNQLVEKSTLDYFSSYDDYISLLLSRIKPTAPLSSFLSQLKYHTYPIDSSTVGQTHKSNHFHTKKRSILQSFHDIIPVQNDVMKMEELWSLPLLIDNLSINNLWSYQNQHLSNNHVLKYNNQTNSDVQPIITNPGNLKGSQVSLNLQAIVNIIEYHHYMDQYMVDSNNHIDQFNSIMSRKVIEERQKQLQSMNTGQTIGQKTRPTIFKPLPHLKPPPNLFDNIITQQRLLNSNCGMNFISWYQILTIQQLSSMGYITIILDSMSRLIDCVKKMKTTITLLENPQGVEHPNNDNSTCFHIPTGTYDVGDTTVDMMSISGVNKPSNHFLQSITFLLDSSTISPLNNRSFLQLSRLLSSTNIDNSPWSDILDANDVLGLFIQRYCYQIKLKKQIDAGNLPNVKMLKCEGTRNGLFGYHFDQFEIFNFYGLLRLIAEVDVNVNQTDSFITSILTLQHGKIGFADECTHSFNALESDTNGTSDSVPTGTYTSNRDQRRMIDFLTDKSNRFVRGLNMLFRSLAHLLFSSIQSIHCISRLFKHTNFSILYSIAMTIAQSQSLLLDIRGNWVDALHPSPPSQPSNSSYHRSQQTNPLSELLSDIQSVTPLNKARDDMIEASLTGSGEILDSLIEIYHLFSPYPLLTSLPQSHVQSKLRPTTHVVPFINLMGLLTRFGELFVPIFNAVVRSASLIHSSSDAKSNKIEAAKIDTKLENIIICDQMVKELWDITH